MTDNARLPDPFRDGKAQAAADKAYRKASRPWFKKKRFIIPLGLVLLMIISSVANSGKDDPSTEAVPVAEATAASDAPAQAAPAKSAAPAKPAAPKQAAPQVLSVEAGQLLADFEGNEAAADAKYKGKILQVTGFVDKVDTEFLDKDQYVVRLDDGAEYSFVHVNCNDLSSETAAAVATGSKATVRGTFQDGGDLGIELKACEVL